MKPNTLVTKESITRELRNNGRELTCIHKLGKKFSFNRYGVSDEIYSAIGKRVTDLKNEGLIEIFDKKRCPDSNKKHMHFRLKFAKPTNYVDCTLPEPNEPLLNKGDTIKIMFHPEPTLIKEDLFHNGHTLSTIIHPRVYTVFDLIELIASGKELSDDAKKQIIKKLVE